MLVCSVEIISRLDSQSKLQVFTLFSGRNVGVYAYGGGTGLCKFVQNNSTKIWAW